MTDSEPLPNVLPEAWKGAPLRSNLAFTLLFLPEEKRRDLAVFYAFCRHVDDLADSTTFPDDMKRAGLETWLDAVDDKIPLPEDLAEVVSRRDLPRELLHEIVLGVSMDLDQKRYGTFEELRRYCWRVACAVGLVSLQLFGCPIRKGEAYAENLGLALQLTNILRDVAEDAREGRIYLPLEDLKKFDVSEEDLLQGRETLGFAQLMQFQARRAQEFYRRASLAFPVEYRRELVAAEAMRGIYYEILEAMRGDTFRVLEKRYRLSLLRKAWIGFRAWTGNRPPTPSLPASS